MRSPWLLALVACSDQGFSPIGDVVDVGPEAAILDGYRPTTSACDDRRAAELATTCNVRGTRHPFDVERSRMMGIDPVQQGGLPGEPRSLLAFTAVLPFAGIPTLLVAVETGWAGFAPAGGLPPRLHLGQSSFPSWTWSGSGLAAVHLEGLPTLASFDSEPPTFVVASGDEARQCDTVEYEGWGTATDENVAALFSATDGTTRVAGFGGVYDLSTPSLVRRLPEGEGRIRIDEVARSSDVVSVADLDLDGVPDIAVGDAIYDEDAVTRCRVDGRDGMTGVADLDRDGRGDVVVLRDGEIAAFDADCQPIWATPFTPVLRYAWMSGGPQLADITGDRVPDVLVARGNGAERCRDNCGVLDAWDGATGAMLWSRPHHILNEWVGLFDFDADGVTEIATFERDPERDVNSLVFLDGAGRVLGRLETGNHAPYRAAHVVDVDLDGHAEIVALMKDWYTGEEPYVAVFEPKDDSWPWAPPIWNQDAYSITNVNLDGTLPEKPLPNWLLYNNYRAGPDAPVSEDGEVPDLVVHIDTACRPECEAGRLTASVRVGNQGLADVWLPVHVRLYGETDGGGEVLLAEWEHEVGVRSGVWEPAHEVIVEDAPFLRGLRAEVDSAPGRVEECDEENNTDTWEVPLCG